MAPKIQDNKFNEYLYYTYIWQEKNVLQEPRVVGSGTSATWANAG